MRRLNIKFLAGLILVAAALGGGAYGLRAFQMRRTARSLIARAEQAERKGDLEKTESYLKQYLAYQPDDTDALVKYGLTIEKRAKTPEDRYRALTNFERVIRRDRDRRDVRRLLVKLAMEPALKGAVDPRPHLEELLRGSTDKASADDGELEYQLARCEEAVGQFDRAKANYEKAVKHAPEQIDAYVRLAGLLQARFNDAAAAGKVMEALIAANPESGRAELARANFRDSSKLGGAEEGLARARELAPDDAEILLTSARREMTKERGDVKKARGYLERAEKLSPHDSRVYEALSMLDLRAGRQDEAAACLRRGVRALTGRDDTDSNQGRLGLTLTLAEILISRGKLEEAAKAVAELRATKALPELIEFLEARILTAKGDWAGATKTLEGLAPRVGAMPGMAALAKQAYLLLGQSYERDGRPDQQSAAFRRAVAIDPQDPAARVGLASALEAMGKVDEAVDEYRKVVRQAPGGAVILARLLILQNLRLPAERRRWEETVQVLDQAAAASPNSVEVPILRAKVLLAQDQPDAVRTLLREACDRYPKQAEPWIALAELAEYQKAPEQVLPVLQEAQGRLGDRVDLRLARAAYWVNRAGPAARAALAELAKGLERFEDPERRRLLRGLSGAYIGLGDAAEAERILTRLTSDRPDDLQSRLVLFDLALRSDKPEAVERVIKGIRQAEGDRGVLWRYARACQLLRGVKPGDKASTAALEEARGHLNAVAARRPGWSRVAVAQAQIDDLKGDQEAALKGYLRAIQDLGERGTAPVRRVVQLLYERRRYEEADQVLRKLRDLDENLGSPDLQQLAADVSLRTGDSDRALTLARKAVPPDSKDYRDQVWLGQVLWASDRRPEAEAALRRASALAPDRPDAWIPLVRFLASTGEKPEAEATILQARTKLPKEQAALALAQCYGLIGQWDQALKLYQEALAAKPGDPAVLRGLAELHLRQGKLEDAKTYLRQIRSLKGEAVDDREWADRVLALVLAAGGSFQDSKEALATLGILDDGTAAKAGAGAGESPETLRTKARVLAMQRGRDRRRQAIQILEALGEREPATASDRDLLARLYEADGNWSKARDQMRILTGSAEANPSQAPYLAHYAGRLLEHQEVAEAIVCLEKLRKLEPASLRTIAIDARAKEAQGQGAEGAALLREYARGHDEESGRVAALIEDLDQPGPAEELYRHAADHAKRPEPLFVLAGFLARQGRAREALDQCELAGRLCPPETLAEVGISVLYTSEADGEQVRRVAVWIDGVLKRDPKSLTGLFNQANLRGIEGRYREAEALYRRCIDANPKNSGPMNNLAWLLAFEQGKGPEALEWANRAIANDGATPDLLDTRAIVYLKMGRAAEAIKDLEDASVAAPRTASLYFHLAQAHLLAKDARAAGEAMKQAKARKLRIANLHPLERKEYQQLETRLAKN